MRIHVVSRRDKMAGQEDTRQVTPGKQKQDPLRAGSRSGTLAVMTVLRELHITRDKGTVMRAEILTDILTPPGRDTIPMRPDTDTETVMTRTETVTTHTETVTTHTGTVTTHTETVTTRTETVTTRTGTVTTRTETVTTHTGTVTTRTETVTTHTETVVTRTETVVTRTGTECHRERADPDTRAYLT